MKRNILITIVGLSIFFSGCSQKKPHIPTASKYTSVKRHKACMKCYTVLGKRYQPTYVNIGDTMQGISSWYGPNFHGKYTSNGEIYNMYNKTAAHKTWPMDTMVRVTNLQNGKRTIVRINDRGPFVQGRIIDCSYAAGKELGLDKMGIAKVKLEVVGFAGKISKNMAKTHTINRVKLKNFGIQVGAFSKYISAKRLASKYNKLYPKYKTIIKGFDTADGKLYRVWMMGFENEKQVIDFKLFNDINGAIVVRL